jgi:hypothetical protein
VQVKEHVRAANKNREEDKADNVGAQNAQHDFAELRRPDGRFGCLVGLAVVPNEYVLQ